MARLFHSDSIVSERDLTSGTNHRSPFSSKVARNSHGRERLERVPTSIFRFRKMILSTISDVQNGEKEREGEGNPPGNACHVAAQRVRVKFERGILATPPTYFITLSTSPGVRPAILEIVEEESLPDLGRQRPFSLRQIRGNNVGRSSVTDGGGNELISSSILFPSLYFSESVYSTPWTGGMEIENSPEKGQIECFRLVESIDFSSMSRVCNG